MIAADVPPFVESRIEFADDRLEYQLSDVDMDQHIDLVVASIRDDGRQLALYRQRGDATFPPVPDWVLQVPPDVVTWTLLDLRPEPGREVLLMTRAGIYSVSTTQAALQGNLRREYAAPLFPDLADPSRLACWRLAHDVDGDGREELEVVSGDALKVLAMETAADGTSHLVERASIPCRADKERRVRQTMSFGNGGFESGSSGSTSSLFPGARTSAPALLGERLLDRSRKLRLPRLLDFDGDGRFERVETLPGAWAVRPLLPATPAEELGMVVPLPEPARKADEKLWLDVDGDGKRELVALDGGSRGEGEDAIAMIFRAHPDAAAAARWTIDDAPSARIKLAGLFVQYRLVDVDHDGRQDLTARVIDVPTGLATLTTVRLDTAFHVFLAGKEATWSRSPDLSWERSFKPEQLTRVQESLLVKLDGDFDGDGINDLVTTQLDGRVEIRGVRRDGDRLALASQPIASFQPPGIVSRLETWDLNGDKVADLVLGHENAMTLFVSRPGAKK